MSAPTSPTSPTSLTKLTDGEWHRLHPATPFLRGGIFVFAVLGFIVANMRERLVEFFLGGRSAAGDPIDEIYRRGAVGWALLVIVVVLVLIMIVFYLSWRMHTFRVNEEIVEVRSGLVFRSNRKARLDRIQGVNIVRSLIPRLVGAARLEVSVAGQDANVQLAYLKSALADDLRRDILRLASGVRQASAPAPAPVDAAPNSGAEWRAAPESALDGTRHASAPEFGKSAAGFGSAIGGFATDRMHDLLAPELDPDAAPPESVVKIPPGRLIGSILVSSFTVVIIFVGIVAIGLTVLNLNASVPGSSWLLFTVVPIVIGTAGYYFSRFTKSLRFSIAGTSDGVRVGFGLLSTSSETLPPGRIHAINVSQPILWRPFGWWQVRINKAGHSSTGGAAGLANTTTLPVGTRADVAKVLELILPGFNTEEQRALIERGMLSKGGDDGFINAPRRAVWLRPFSWRRTGYTVSTGVAFLRRGAISRELILVPLARLQSVGIEQGPLQRMLRLASARLHTVAGPVTASLGVIGAHESVSLFEAIAVGAVESANADTSHHWNQSAEASE